MAENDQKGWFGSFSSAGKSSAGKYHLIVHKDEILSNFDKRLKMKDIFSPDENILNDDSLVDHLDIFKFTPKEPQHILGKTGISNKKSISNSKDKFHYHNKHINEKKPPKKPDGPISRYNPKMDCIWKRTISGPPWKTLKGRKKSKSVDTKDFYIGQNTLNTKLKGFIELNKQTMRLEFPTPNDIRIKNEVKYYPKNNSNSSFECSNNERRCAGSNANNTNYGKHSFNQNDHSSKSNGFQSFPSLIDGKRCYVPDFKRSISRDKFERRFQISQGTSGLCNPNYNVISQRPVMMVAYNKGSSKLKRKGLRDMEPFTAYNTYKVFGKATHHSIDSMPLFSKDKTSENNTTTKTLQKSNINAQTDYLPSYTLFYPKKSFNSVVNLNLLNSKQVTSNTISKKIESSDLEKYLVKGKNFYTKNYDETKILPKFDAVTLKSYNKGNKKSIDPEKLLELIS